MILPDPQARLPQIQPEECTEETREFFDRWSDGFFNNVDSNPVLLTLAHNPSLANAFSPLNVHLLTNNSLPVKQRQIAIMRTAWVCQCTYMWSSHLGTSQRCGVSTDVFEPIKKGADDPYFTEFESLLIKATDELVHEKRISIEHWQALALEWSSQQLLDFMFTVGCYVMLAGVMSTAGVERKEDLRELAEKYGAP